MQCFQRNYDGAGYAVNKKGKNYINKGFFDFKQFYDALEEEATKDVPAIIHFRLGTSGGKTSKQCHPFPLVNDIKEMHKTELETNEIVAAHNGVFSISSKENGVSDTMEFIRNILSADYIKETLFEEESIQNLLELALDNESSRMAFMSPSGKLLWLGEFDEHEGIFYSNKGYVRYNIQYTSWDANGRQNTRVSYTDDPACLGNKDIYDEKDSFCKQCSEKAKCCKKIEEKKEEEKKKKEEVKNCGIRCEECKKVPTRSHYRQLDKFLCQDCYNSIMKEQNT